MRKQLLARPKTATFALILAPPCITELIHLPSYESFLAFIPALDKKCILRIVKACHPNCLRGDYPLSGS